ncbi:putative gamma-secretase-activating protein-like [Apostichopus japonicus]|uniref:Putative gamma-secretase-activating protein-like n=1 Tax=Stichopus japonicus TaxID=307972 RepID=A0A2G8LIJ5_STIJA|nr:putative gamma-secretase-activating protein-like [Apostichopus japonicus]
MDSSCKLFDGLILLDQYYAVSAFLKNVLVSGSKYSHFQGPYIKMELSTETSNPFEILKRYLSSIQSSSVYSTLLTPTFTRFFNLRDHVVSEIVDESSSSSGLDTGYLNGQNINLRVVGQEQNHELLLVWDDFLPFSSPKKMVTFIGSYHPSSKQFKKLFTFESTVNIVNCSLSPDRCIVAYTTRTTRDKENDIYSAYLAEIHNRVRTCIYSLNFHHDSLIKVQFLWPLKNCPEGDPIAKESRLLVLLHNQSVGIYTINLRRTGIGMVLHNLPVAEQVSGSFIWAQWDKQDQRLYLLVPRTKSGKAKKIFRCLEFGQGGTVPATPVIEMELPFPIKDHHFERNLYHNSLSQTVSEDWLNMQVITQSQGIFCICYQHVPQRPRRLTKTVSSPILKARSNSACLPSVSILSSPSEHSISRTLSTESQPRKDRDYRNSLTASLPTSPTESYPELKRSWSSLDQDKTVTHVDISYSILCVHKSTLISAKVHQVPREKVKGLRLFFGAQDGYIFVYCPGIAQHLVNITSEFRSSHHIALHPAEQLFTPSNQEKTASKLVHISCELTSKSGGTCIYDISYQTAFQYSWNKKLLCQALHPCLAKPLLHHAVIQARDNQMREEIMNRLTQDPTDTELVPIFLEFIISSTYAAVRKQVDDRSILAFFPFTTEVTMQQLLQTPEGERTATFTTSSCKHKVDISAERVRQFIIPTGNPYLFSRLERSPGEVKKWIPKYPEIFNSTSKTQNRPNHGNNTKPKHVEALQRHLSQCLTYASPEKLLQIATIYCDCQIQQVHHLMNILIRSTGLDDKSSPSVWDLSLCLDFPSFLQYVEHDVFQLNKNFLLKFLKDLPDDQRVNREKKKIILSMLPSRDLQMEMLRSWNHPEGNAILTKIYLEKNWFSEAASVKDNPPDQPDSPSSNFPPLSSLLRYIVSPVGVHTIKVLYLQPKSYRFHSHLWEDLIIASRSGPPVTVKPDGFRGSVQYNPDLWRGLARIYILMHQRKG